MTQQRKNNLYFLQNLTFVTHFLRVFNSRSEWFYTPRCHQHISSFCGIDLLHCMNPLDVFCQNLTQNLIQAPGLRQKWIEENDIISWVWSFCCVSFVIWSLFHSTLSPPCQNSLRSLSHFLSSSSVSLCISLFIISGRKPLMFSLSLNIFDMLKFPFESHISAPALGSFITWLPDSSHLCICHWSKVVRGEECKKRKKQNTWKFCLAKIQSLLSDQS